MMQVCLDVCLTELLGYMTDMQTLPSSKAVTITRNFLFCLQFLGHLGHGP